MQKEEKINEVEIEVKFREWINQKEWFYYSLIKNNISIWNFNLFILSNPHFSYLAVRSDNTEIIKELKKLGYIVIDNYKGITLLKKEVIHS
jgi:replicative DNA helicase